MSSTPLGPPVVGEYVSPVELARHLGTTPAALAGMRYRGEGPAFVKVGRRTVRYAWADVEAWIEARRTLPTATTA